MRSNFCNFVQRHRSFKISGMMGKGRSKDLAERNRKYEGTDLSPIILHFHGENAPSEKVPEGYVMLDPLPSVFGVYGQCCQHFLLIFRPFLNIVLEKY